MLFNWRRSIWCTTRLSLAFWCSSWTDNNDTEQEQFVRFVLFLYRRQVSCKMRYELDWSLWRNYSLVLRYQRFHVLFKKNSMWSYLCEFSVQEFESVSIHTAVDGNAWAPMLDIIVDGLIRVWWAVCRSPNDDDVIADCCYWKIRVFWLQKLRKRKSGPLLFPVCAISHFWSIRRILTFYPSEAICQNSRSRQRFNHVSNENASQNCCAMQQYSHLPFQWNKLIRYILVMMSEWSSQRPLRSFCIAFFPLAPPY